MPIRPTRIFRGLGDYQNPFAGPVRLADGTIVSDPANTVPTSDQCTPFACGVDPGNNAVRYWCSYYNKMVNALVCADPRCAAWRSRIPGCNIQPSAPSTVLPPASPIPAAAQPIVTPGVVPGIPHSTTTPGKCFPLAPPFNPLCLASNYRDYFGDANACLTEIVTSRINAAGCYVSRIFHAPDTSTETAGVRANGFLEYVLSIPAGSFIMGFLHTFTSGSPSATDAPVSSGFKFQITDVGRDYRWFAKPLPEAWLLNDEPSSNSQELSQLPIRVLNPSPRLLPAAYPVAPPGSFKIEFWNQLSSVNSLIRLSLLVAVPSPDMVAA